MPYIRDSFWRGREFGSLARMQTEAERWCRDVAGMRACRPLDGASPLAVFGVLEKPRLAPLPAGGFVLAEWRTAKVGPDIHASVAKVLYSIGWRHIGKTLDVRLTATMVQFSGPRRTGQDPPAQAARQADRPGRLPAGKVAHFMRTPAWCRRQAAAIGPACAQVIDELMTDNALYRLRAAQGVIGLAENTTPPGSRRPAPARSTPGTPPIRPSAGSSPPAPKHSRSPRPPAGRGAGAYLRGPGQIFGNVLPFPATAPGAAADLAASLQEGESS